MIVRAGVDWGSTAFRAYRLDQDAQCIDEVVGGEGLKALQGATPATFESTLFDHIGHWLQPDDTVLLSGMVTSRSGWQETPYLPCPVDVRTLPDSAMTLDRRNIKLCFLPGISQTVPSPDVMRGEELQILGASLNANISTVVLPGTHSKWARVNGFNLEMFHTLMTGELFDIVLNHSLVGELSSSCEMDARVFSAGVERGFASDSIIAELFSSRASVLLKLGSSDALYSHLSGLLIGREIRDGLQRLAVGADEPILLVGDAVLCSLYEQALCSLDRPVVTASGNSAVSGFQQLAKQSTV